jgi:peroxiredoxin Q/BCP
VTQLVQLQKDINEIEAANIQIVGISYDSVDVLAKFAKKRNITFPLLADPDSKAIDAYGVRNERTQGRQSGIPNPMTIIVDGNLKVRGHLPGSVVRRHSTKKLIEMATTLSKE